MTRHMRRRATQLANTSYYQGMRAKTRLGMQRLGATGVVKMHTAPNRFEIIVREVLILGVCLCAASTLVLAVELRDRASDWGPVAFIAQAGLFVLAGYVGYAVDRRGPLPRLIDFSKDRQTEIPWDPSCAIVPRSASLTPPPVCDCGGHDLPMPTSKRGGIRYGEVTALPPTTREDFDPEDPLIQVQQLLASAGDIITRERLAAEGDETIPEDFDRWAALGDARAGVSDAVYHLGKITEILYGAAETCGCRLPTRDVHRGRTDLIDASGCTEGHHAW